MFITLKVLKFISVLFPGIIKKWELCSWKWETLTEHSGHFDFFTFLLFFCQFLTILTTNFKNEVINGFPFTKI